MGEDEKNRLIAWNRELAAAHQRLRLALHVTRDALGAGDAGPAGADLLLYCHGFCAALSGHHASEDAALFPELTARHPELSPVIAKLAADHEMIAALLSQFGRAVTAAATPGELARHLDGLSAIMESHFGYEERQLRGILSALHLAADPHALLGPLLPGRPPAPAASTAPHAMPGRRRLCGWRSGRGSGGGRTALCPPLLA